jgi:hypothetical protein
MSWLPSWWSLSAFDHAFSPPIVASVSQESLLRSSLLTVRKLLEAQISSCQPKWPPLTFVLFQTVDGGGSGWEEIPVYLPACPLLCSQLYEACSGQEAAGGLCSEKSTLWSHAREGL